MSESNNGIVVQLRPHSEGELDALKIQNVHLQSALQSRIVIEQAKGAVSAHLGTTPEVAFEMLRGLAKSQGRKLTEYAAGVIENGGRLDG
jgi:AmiR/NasT family two-component response regulator